MLRLVVSTFLALALCWPAYSAQKRPNWRVDAICKLAPPLTPKGKPYQSCVKEERDARTQLYSQWATFSEQSRSTCVQELSIEAPSYVDVLTCLQMFAANSRRQ